MAIPGVHDPDFTLIDLGQTTHFGSSGTLVSDEELVCASGFLQTQIDGAASIASGVFNDQFAPLSLLGDDSTVKSREIFNIPVAEYTQNADLQVLWNVRAPLPITTSGITFGLGWASSTSVSGTTIKFEVQSVPIAEGSDISTLTPNVASVVVSGNFTANIINTTFITLPTDTTTFHAIKFSRLGTQDLYNGDVRVLVHAVRFEPL